jgi:hypothetical protein
MKRLIPLLITSVGGFVLIVAFFIPALQESGEIVAVWFDILASIAFILGGGNLLKVHLKKISDRAAGWGYSGVTLLAFLATLIIGMFKFGSPPAEITEYHGVSMTPLPVAAMPTYAAPGEIPQRGDDAPLPASVRGRNLLHEEDGQLVFRGWMSETQRDDLLAYQDTRAWRDAVNRLYELAQPPEPLESTLSYRPDHEALTFAGYMSPEEEANLEALFSGNEAALGAVDRLAAMARRESAVANVVFPGEIPSGGETAVPGNFAIPEGSEHGVARSGDSLTIQGPMSLELRNEVAVDWANPPRVGALTSQRREEILSEIEAGGPPLDAVQRESLEKVFQSYWTEPLAELNAAQLQTLTAALDDPALQEGLPAQLEEAGPFSEVQHAAVEEFLAKRPTKAEFQRELAIALLKATPREKRAGRRVQLEALTEDYRLQSAWQSRVDELFRKAHVVKYAWSGEFQAVGSAFWWIYEFILQPLMATMFAMLAFYVASAAFRAFRAKNIEAALLLGTAFIVLLGRTFVGVWLTSWIPDALSALRLDELTVYIMSIFNTAAQRAIMIGIALGIAATSLKILLGIDRSYLGGGDE